MILKEYDKLLKVFYISLAKTAKEKKNILSCTFIIYNVSTYYTFMHFSCYEKKTFVKFL